MWLFCFLIAGQLQTAPTRYHEVETLDVYRCRSLAASPDGVVALIDRDAPRIVLWHTADRAHVVSDRAGAGPGEWRAPLEVCWVDDLRAFAVIDPGNNRLSYRRTDGSVLREVPLSQPGLMQQFAAGDLMFTTRDAYGMNTREAKLERIDLARGTRDVLWSYHLPEQRSFSTGMGENGSFRIMYRWDPCLIFGVGSDFVLVGFSDQAALYRLGLGTDSRPEPLAYSMPRVPVSDAQLEGGVNLMPADMQPGLRRGLLKPESWPYLRHIVVDEQDRIFLVGAAADVGARHPLQAIDRRGTLLGEARIDGPAMAARGGKLYFLTEGEDTLRLGEVAYTL